MLKPIWLLFLCILLYVTIVSSTEDIHKRKNCHDEDDESKKTIIRTGHKTASTSTIREHKITVILATIADKTTTSTSINEPTHKAYEDHFHDCDDERACDHSCTDNPCGHTCKDGPCHVVCIYRTPPPKYEPQIVAAGVILMTLGLFMMFMGFPFFIVTMAITGLLLGSSVTWICLHALEPPQGYPIPSTFYLGCSAGGGVLLALISLFWWKFTTYLLCGAAGYLLSLFIWTWKEDFILQDILARNIIGLALGFIFILGFVLIEFATVILSTSLIGAYTFVFGLDLFVKSGFFIGLKTILDFNRHSEEDNNYRDASYAGPMNDSSKFYAHYNIDTKVHGMLFAVIGLWIVSTIWQRHYNSGNRFGLRVIMNSNDTLKAIFQKTTPKALYSSTE